MCRLEIIPARSLSAADREAWRTLQASDAAFASPLLGPDFTDLVGRLRDDLAVAALRRGGEALAFFPHHRRPGRMARPVGAPFSDIHAVVSGPDLPMGGAEFLARAGLRRFRYSGLADPHGLFAAPARAVTSYLIDLEAGAGPCASGHRLKKLRRHQERLESEAGALGVVAGDTDPAAFTRLLDWKSRQLRRTGLHDVIAGVWPHHFLCAAFAARTPGLRGLMVTLRAGGLVVAGLFGVEADGVYHPWISAYDPALASHGPGALLLQLMSAPLAAIGVRRIELGPSGDAHKAPVANATRVLFSGASPAARGQAGEGSVWARLDRRLDHIVTAELDVRSRARGLAQMIAHLPRRAFAKAAR
jgi:CelD/BcsL family acetyltransferase involved in cellulose biosynthesis